MGMALERVPTDDGNVAVANGGGTPDVTQCDRGKMFSGSYVADGTAAASNSSSILEGK